MTGSYLSEEFNGRPVFLSCPEDCGSEEAGGAPGLQVPPQLAQSLWRLHAWIRIAPWTGTRPGFYLPLTPNIWLHLVM